jgi:CubicO group peptidase (beta-lactamase class C family)
MQCSSSGLPRRSNVAAFALRSAVLTALGVLSACGGGGGGGGGSNNPPPSNPPPTAPANQAPTVTLGADQTVELPNATVALTATASDPESQTLTYTWTADPAANVTFESASAKDTNAQFAAAGTYTLKLVASDGTASAEDTIVVTVNGAVYPAADTDADAAHGWTIAAPADVGMNEAELIAARDYALTGGGSGLISRRGRLVYQWGDIDIRTDLKSTTKSLGGIALGLAMDDAKVASLNDTAQTYLPTLGTTPANDPTWLSQITVRQLATHTAGFEKNLGYPALIYQPGTTWSYSDGALNWLADLLTDEYAQDLGVLLNTRVWSVLGINAGVNGIGDDLQWRDNKSGRPLTDANGVKTRELASGINANVNAMARVGLLFLRKGVWANDQRVLSEAFVQLVQTPQTENATATIANPTAFPGATSDYGVLWWTNKSGLLPNVPKDAYWGWGLGDSLIVVIPSLDLVIARTGSDPDSKTLPHWRTAPDGSSAWDGNYTVLDPFLTPIVRSVTP